MNITFQKINASKDTLLSMRQKYLDDLPFAQEYYLELVIPNCNLITITDNHEYIGYAIVTNDFTLLEFHVSSRYRLSVQEILTLLIDEERIRNIICKTFDYTLLNFCLANGFTYTVDGLMFRNRLVDDDFVESTSIIATYAREEHIAFFQQQDDEVFEPKECLQEAVDQETIIVFEDNERIIGCGFINLIYPKAKYCDIGVWVDPNNRKKGYGSYIINYLSNRCRIKQLTPVCGCGADNLVSQRTLNKCGYYSEFSLVNFRTKFA